MRLSSWARLALVLPIAYPLIGQDSSARLSTPPGLERTLGQLLPPEPAVGSVVPGPTSSGVPSYTEHHDIPYGSATPAHPEQVLDIYLPILPISPIGLAPAPGVPVILFLHSNGDVGSDEDIFIGSPGMGDFLKRGIAVVTADYGGWPTDNFDLPQRHVVECVNWMYTNETVYGWDAGKLGIMGKSFGGMLGSCVTYGNFGNPPAPRPAAFISMIGMLDWTALDPMVDFSIVEHFGAGLKKTKNVPLTELDAASGLQILLNNYSGPQLPPPAFAWAEGGSNGIYGRIKDPHDAYFGFTLVDILQSQFGDTDSVFVNPPGGQPRFPYARAAAWFRRIVK